MKTYINPVKVSGLVEESKIVAGGTYQTRDGGIAKIYDILGTGMLVGNYEYREEQDPKLLRWYADGSYCDGRSFYDLIAVLSLPTSSDHFPGKVTVVMRDVHAPGPTVMEVPHYVVIPGKDGSILGLEDVASYHKVDLFVGKIPENYSERVKWTNALNRISLLTEEEYQLVKHYNAHYRVMKQFLDNKELLGALRKYKEEKV